MATGKSNRLYHLFIYKVKWHYNIPISAQTENIYSRYFLIKLSCSNIIIIMDAIHISHLPIQII